LTLDTLEQQKVYCLFDTSVIAAYYLPRSHKNPKVSELATKIIESVRSGGSKNFLYIPNFCIAEVFSTFCKYTYGSWNRQVKGAPIDSRVHESLRDQFSRDLHNGTVFYHYELTRYHVLGINMVAAIDHYYTLGHIGKHPRKPAGTFDQLIVSMALQLVKIHGTNNVVLITADHRLAKLVARCRKMIPDTPRKKLRIKWIEEFVGIDFKPENFPLILNLNKENEISLKHVFGIWPHPVASRYGKPYHLKPQNRRKLL
jgi:hypothetical protein